MEDPVSLSRHAIEVSDQYPTEKGCGQTASDRLSLTSGMLIEAGDVGISWRSKGDADFVAVKTTDAMNAYAERTLTRRSHQREGSEAAAWRRRVEPWEMPEQGLEGVIGYGFENRS
jgi:hypothetical protein